MDVAVAHMFSMLICVCSLFRRGGFGDGAGYRAVVAHRECPSCRSDLVLKKPDHPSSKSSTRLQTSLVHGSRLSGAVEF